MDMSEVVKLLQCIVVWTRAGQVTDRADRGIITPEDMGVD